MRPQPSIAFDWLNDDVRDLRQRYERAYHVQDDGNSVWRTIEIEGRPLRLLLQQPAHRRASSSILVYFHGGGWIVGSPATHADISRALCERTGLDVMSVDYRLAPENPAPAPIEDGLAALAYAFSGGLGDSGRKTAILCGDSAGAAIALATERRLGQALRERILGVGAFYGGYGILETASSPRWGSLADGLDQGSLTRMWRLANGSAMPSPYAVNSLAGPTTVPVYILAASRDPLLADSLALAEACRQGSRPFALDLIEGLSHGFLHDADISEPAAAALARVTAWIGRLLA
jgi:acetyl esterase